jgi:hypothetical protein
MNIYLNKKKITKNLKKASKGQLNLKSLASGKLINKKFTKLKKILKAKNTEQSSNRSGKDLQKLSMSTLDSLNNSQNKISQKIKKKKRMILNTSTTLISGKYLIKKLIGKGSNNKVYLAEQIFNKKLYAVKVFKLKDLKDEKKMNYLKVGNKTPKKLKLSFFVSRN